MTDRDSVIARFRVTEAIVGMLPRFCSKVHVFMPRTRVRGTLTLYMWRRFYHNVDAMRGIHVVANVQILKKNCTVKFVDTFTMIPGHLGP